MPRSAGPRNGSKFQRKRPNPGERARRPLLNLGRLDYFKYDLNEIIKGIEMDENLIGSFKASIIAKSSNISIQSAKDYIGEVESREGISKDGSAKIFRLLDRYTSYR